MKYAELKKLNRQALLEILVAQSRRIDELEEQLAEAKAALQERSIMMDDAGSIAEAALKINEVFEAAQAAADQYLKGVRESGSSLAHDGVLAGETAGEVSPCAVSAESQSLPADGVSDGTEPQAVDGTPSGTEPQVPDDMSAKAEPQEVDGASANIEPGECVPAEPDSSAAEQGRQPFEPSQQAAEPAQLAQEPGQQPDSAAADVPTQQLGERASVAPNEQAPEMQAVSMQDRFRMLVPDPRPDASEGATLEAHAPHGKTVFQRAKEAIEAGLAESDDDVPTLPYGPSMPIPSEDGFTLDGFATTAREEEPATCAPYGAHYAIPSEAAVPAQGTTSPAQSTASPASPSSGDVPVPEHGGPVPDPAPVPVQTMAAEQGGQAAFPHSGLAQAGTASASSASQPMPIYAYPYPYAGPTSQPVPVEQSATGQSYMMPVYPTAYGAQGASPTYMMPMPWYPGYAYAPAPMVQQQAAGQQAAQQQAAGQREPAERGDAHET